MSEEIDKVDLSAYSIGELSKLVERAKKEIAHKEQIQVQEVRNQIQKLASGLNMTVEQLLQLDTKKKKVVRLGKIKYRNPADPSQTWTGRGKQPNWLREALGKGARKEDFAV
jgi:DNA-binding protein H-NS